MKRNEWERLEWSELPDSTLWTRRDAGVRWFIEYDNERACSILFRLNGAGASFLSERRAERDEANGYISRGTVESFENTILQTEGGYIDVD